MGNNFPFKFCMFSDFISLFLIDKSKVWQIGKHINTNKSVRKTNFSYSAFKAS